MEQRFEKWNNWLDKIDVDVCRLISNRTIFREVQEIIDNNPKIQSPNLFYAYLEDTYVAFTAMAVRRQIKPHKNCISFTGLLREIIDTPCVLSRERFTNMYPKSMQKHANSDFSQFAGSCEDHVDPNVVRQDLKNLNDLGSELEVFADKRIAHYDKREPKKIPTFNNLDACIDYLEELTKKYLLLFRAVARPSLVTNLDDWQEIFREPWILPDDMSSVDSTEWWNTEGDKEWDEWSP